MSEAFLWIDEKQVGPFSIAQVGEMMRDGQIANETLFRTGGEEWRPVGEAPYFANLKEQPPAETVAPSNQTLAPEWHRWEATSHKAGWAVGIGMLCVTIGALCIFIGGLKDGPARAELFAGGGLIGAGFWLAVLGQIMHVRAAVEKMADRDDAS